LTNPLDLFGIPIPFAIPNKQPNPEPSETGTNSLNAQRSSKKFTSICIPIARPDLLSQGGKGILHTHIYIYMDGLGTRNPAYKRDNDDG